MDQRQAMELPQLAPYLQCALFREKLSVASEKCFVVRQKELVLSGSHDQQAHFNGVDVDYACSFLLRNSAFDDRKPFIIIPSRNHSDLIRFTLDNLRANAVDRICNIMVVDDRSTESYPEVLGDYPAVSYLRIDNRKGFNFSMLCNIAAYVARDLGCSEAIFWNNDLWVAKREFLEALIARHRRDSALISGSKLLYPLRSFNGDAGDTATIDRDHPSMRGRVWRGTVQFGGASWVRQPNSPLALTPLHFRRFAAPDDPLVNCDKGDTFVTGALHLVDLPGFLALGGYNPSLSRTLQDVEICLRANERKQAVMYYGKDVFFYHDESLTFNAPGETKYDAQVSSDVRLFGVLWNSKIRQVVL